MELDTFDTPLENAEETSTPDTNLTMDDMDEIEEKEEKDNIDKVDPENDQIDGEEKKVEGKSEDKKEKDGKDGKDGKKESDDKPKEDEEKEDDNDDKSSEPKPTGKKLIGKIGDEKFDIPSDLEIPVKINGKTEHFTIAELRNLKSGEVAYDRKFTELSQKEKEITESRDKIAEPINQFIDKVQAVYKDESADPLEPLAFMIDLLGGDSYNYIQKVFESQYNQFEELSEMSEPERDNYFLKRQNEHLRKRQESELRMQGDKKTQAELNSKVTQVRETHGISEDDYLSTIDLMKNRGQDEHSNNPEAVAKYFVTEQAIEKAEGIAQKLGHDINSEDSDEMISDLTNFILKFPDITPDEIIEEFREDEIDNDIKSLAKRGSKKPKAKEFDNSYEDNENELDMFDDYN